MLCEPSDTAQLRSLLMLARQEEIPVTVIGQGSNLLVLDGGIRGMVIRVGRQMREICVDGQTMICEGGAMMATAAQTAAENSLSGAVFMCGIPGTVGGGVFMNAGAYGGEMKDCVTLVEGLNMAGEAFAYTGDQMEFGYRTSRLKAEGGTVTRVTMSLVPGDRDTLLADMRTLKQRRSEKQPLDVPSAGSTFKRPEGYFAAALIDQCGLKGFSVGGAQVSEKHAGFLVNRGESAADYLSLIRQVQRIVLEKTGVALETEVRILGEA